MSKHEILNKFKIQITEAFVFIFDIISDFEFSYSSLPQNSAFPSSFRTIVYVSRSPAGGPQALKAKESWA